MDIPKAGTQPRRLNEMTHAVAQDKSDATFTGAGVTTIGPQSQITSQENDNKVHYSPVVERKVEASSQVTASDEATPNNCWHSSKAQVRSNTDDPGAEAVPCKMMKRDAMAISTDRDKLERIVERLFKIITDADNTDADIEKAKSLISEYGADELAKCTGVFSIDENLFYPAITPFALACRFGKLDLVKALFVNQEQLDQTFELTNGTNGRTVLMLATMKGHANVVEQLLVWGANPQILDEANNGVNAINFAYNGYNQDLCSKIIVLLQNARRERNLPSFEDAEPDRVRYQAVGSEGYTFTFNREKLKRKFLDYLESKYGK
ncbi:MULTISPECIES: ankyrin repeat domain-containing protein [unclassified Endozoicomonas]|uniref:ankyrin repeat domain-containing protein n=1 Tax=unclassified Endozoicomonas TaxID=2644528 RepID=UPI002148EA80|nr:MULTISPECIES: ankyrin repeat domain-containing protein [unclassified Endozoicomonas]